MKLYALILSFNSTVWQFSLNFLCKAGVPNYHWLHQIISVSDCLFWWFTSSISNVGCWKPWRSGDQRRASLSWKERRSEGTRPRRRRIVVWLSLVQDMLSPLLSPPRRSSCCKGHTASPSWCSRGWSRWGRWVLPGPPPVVGSCPPAGLHSKYSESCKHHSQIFIVCVCQEW